jgi:D-sedoheptulose 7-phosphate isomerase
VTPEGTDFLYPFIEGDERDAAALLSDLAASAQAKGADSRALREATLAGCADELVRAADAMAERFERGARLFAAGNGGSSTDAASLVALFAHPPRGRPLPARSLVADEAILTALGNDVGFDLVFSRQVIAYGSAHDIVVGFSTSGNSANLIGAFDQARRLGILTVGLAGYDGGAMVSSGTVDHVFVVPSASVHRIQEAQDALALALWSAVQDRLAVTAGVP